ncbi:MAG: helix-turn-helix domain-containing protein [Coriobacteriales bacterium]|nr:helix-turn-helix domain-containing protein [Coriobacteriales bacterium]
MELNLHIIAEDLSVFKPQCRLCEDYDVLRLRLPALFDGSCTKRSLLYVVKASELTPEAVEKVTELSSLLVIGRPPKALMDKDCNLAWVNSSVSLERLFFEVVELFSSYEIWANHMQDVLISKAHLKRLGELASPIVRRPLYLVDSHLQLVFSVVDEEHYRLPEDYSSPHADGSGAALNTVTLERYCADALEPHLPFMLSSDKSYGTLAQNIFLGNCLVATLSFDEVGAPFTKRDYALIVICASFLTQGLTYHDDWNTSAPRQLDEQVRALLEGRQYAPEDLESALKTMAWRIGEAYFCVVATPVNPLFPSGLLAAAAKHACARASHMVYVIFEHRMVFIVNADHSVIPQDETVDLLVSDLSKYQIHLGVSNVFNHFWMLAFAYRLAVSAQEIGVAKDPCRPFHRFEDYFMDYLVSATRQTTPLEAIIPRGLMQLKRYDDEYGTDYLRVLDVYLKHDMRAAPASRELFLHRNTLAHKIAQIKFISRMDFEEDPHVRLQALVALHMMDA